MKKVLLVLSALFISLCAFAARQDVAVSGKVVDKNTREPLEWVTIAVRDAAENVLGGTTTDEKGQFSIVAPEGSTITASFIGYNEVSVQVRKNLLIELEPASQQLGTVTVTAKVPLIEAKIDKLVMNVGQSAFSQGSNGLELLKKAPGVVVDGEGNVTLNGKTVSIWIDGRPSHVDGKSLEALLRSTDGSTIDKFEIMEHPSSKYDAEGQGGIINIKTKRSFAAGFNGNVGINGGGMYFGKYELFPWKERAWANLSYRGKKTNTFLNLSQGYNQYINDYDAVVSAPSSVGLMEQKTHVLSDDINKDWNLRLVNDWFVNDRNTLGFIVTMPGEIFLTYCDPTYNNEKHFLDSSLLYSATGLIDEKSTQTDMSGNLNYTHVFDPARNAEITTNFDYYRINNYKTTNQHMTFDGEELPYLTRNIKADNAVNIWSAKSDYQTLLWQRVMFEAGVKGALSLTNSDTDHQETGLGAHCENPRFTYREVVGAGYFNAATQFGQKWSAKAGLRAEYTNSFGDWISTGDHSQHNYTNFFPTVFVGYNPNENWRLGTSYTRRIKRPGYFCLNPNKSYTGSNSYVIGNPDLQPEFIDDVNVFAGFGQYLNFAVGYNHTANWIMQNPYIDEDANTIYKWENFGSNNIYYTSLNLSQLPLCKWLEWTMNVAGLYFTGHTADGSYNTKSFNLQSYTCFTFNLPKDWKIELDGTLETPMKVGYLNLKTQWYFDLAVRKPLLDGRMILNAGLSDIFRSQGTCFTIDASANGNPSSSVIDQIYMRQKVSVGFTWNFGTAQQPLRQRNVGNLEEATRGKDSGGSIGN